MSKKIILSSLLVSTLVLGTATSFADSVSTVDSSTPVPGVVTTKPSKDKDKDKDNKEVAGNSSNNSTTPVVPVSPTTPTTPTTPATPSNNENKPEAPVATEDKKVEDSTVASTDTTNDKPAPSETTPSSQPAESTTPSSSATSSNGISLSPDDITEAPAQGSDVKPSSSASSQPSSSQPSSSTASSSKETVPASDQPSTSVAQKAKKTEATQDPKAEPSKKATAQAQQNEPTLPSTGESAGLTGIFGVVVSLFALALVKMKKSTN